MQLVQNGANYEEVVGGWRKLKTRERSFEDPDLHAPNVFGSTTRATNPRRHTNDNTIRRDPLFSPDPVS